HVGTDDAAGARLASETDHPPSLAERTFRRYTPEVGAVCGKAARTVLCGGACDETHVPTATEPPRVHHAAWRRGGGVAPGGAGRVHGAAGRRVPQRASTR